MIRFHAFGVAFTLPLLSLITPLLCIRLGMQMKLSALIFALSLHELAHVLAARVLGVQIEEIRLTPFGGSARIENPYGLQPAKLAATAAAGPGANLLCAICFAAFTEWKLLLPETSAEHVFIHLTLFLFNLIPALPLDGGRILYCLLQRFSSRRNALNACIWTGRIIAASIVLLALAGFYIHKRLNLCLIMMAVFILISAQDERDALDKSSMQKLTFAEQSKIPVRFYQISGDSTILDALRLIRPREANWFLLLQQGKPAGLLDGQTIAEFIRSGGASDTELGRLPMIKFMQESNQSAQVHPRTTAAYQMQTGFR